VPVSSYPPVSNPDLIPLGAITGIIALRWVF
jgi:hypothetical protein